MSLCLMDGIIVKITLSFIDDTLRILVHGRLNPTQHVSSVLEQLVRPSSLPPPWKQEMKAFFLQ